MYNYSSTKLELLVLKWLFHYYLLGSKFQVYMDNNPLAYVREGKLGTSQNRCLSELSLFNFTIHYQTGRSDRADDAPSRHSHNEDSSTKSDSDSDEIEVISYSSVCEVVDLYLETTKITDALKKEVLSISCAVQSLIEERMWKKSRVCLMLSQSLIM